MLSFRFWQDGDFTIQTFQPSARFECAHSSIDFYPTFQKVRLRCQIKRRRGPPGLDYRRYFAELEMLQFNRSLACLILTPLEILSRPRYSLQGMTRAWLMGQQGREQPITLHFMRWMCRSTGIAEGRPPTLGFNHCWMRFGLGTEINLLPAPFITAGTLPINFKSLSATWSICPTWNPLSLYAGNLKTHFLHTIRP